MRRLGANVDRAVAGLSWLGAAFGALAILLSLVLIVYSVAARYFWGQPQPWIDELVGYLLVASVMATGAEALRKGDHIAVDIATNRLGPAGKTAVAAAGMIAAGIVGFFLATEGWEMVAFSRMVGQVSTGRLEVAMAIPQSLVPLGGVLMIAAAISGLIRLASGRPATEEHRADETPFPEKKSGID